MNTMNHFLELVNECKWKLNRNLTKQELELIVWIQDKQLDALYENVKTS
ncbi:hypothetical protein [Alkalihalobacillus trypoxylicola]|nr:hypothetical protein [Alkalihalobacillus trypoxylicola]GAF64215.1 hypothetical protein BTS2_1107 [Bacillus sp. TS-2]